ncbi:MAG TPA: hypothetical protein VFQ61_08670, partial [Polyangiaceae bacterium]|nr:hypothetical protein [Polyangiaceae bacterium]
LGSALQYYELINTQWPTDPSAPPADIQDYPSNITNKSGGKPTPVFLINAVMETYFQGGASSANGAGKPEQVHLSVNEDGSAGSPGYDVPSTNGGNTPLDFAEGFCRSVGANCGDAAGKLVLSTESCMGCHSSAGIAKAAPSTAGGTYQFASQLSADFSWLLQQKAQPRAAK